MMAWSVTGGGRVAFRGAQKRAQVEVSVLLWDASLTLRSFAGVVDGSDDSLSATKKGNTINLGSEQPDTQKVFLSTPPFPSLPVSLLSLDHQIHICSVSVYQYVSIIVISVFVAKLLVTHLRLYYRTVPLHRSPPHVRFLHVSLSLSTGARSVKVLQRGTDPGRPLFRVQRVGAPSCREGVVVGRRGWRAAFVPAPEVYCGIFQHNLGCVDPFHYFGASDSNADRWIILFFVLAKTKK